MRHVLPGMDADSGCSNSVAAKSSQMVELRSPSELGRDEAFWRYCTAPSAARTGSRRATFLISTTASWTRAIAGCERQPKAFRRKRAADCQRYFESAIRTRDWNSADLKCQLN